MNRKLAPSNRMKSIEGNEWSDCISLAVKYKALNFGVGFPDFKPPKCLTNDAADILKSTALPLINQYARSVGHVRFVKAIANFFSPLFNRKINALSEVAVGPGSDIGAYLAIQAFVNPTDEVILIEPYFDCYKPAVLLSGATPVVITLRPALDENNNQIWSLDFDELKRAFGGKTKAIILNNPHNPTGKVFNEEELEKISDLCRRYNVLCISDEVYQFLAYDGLQHCRIASLPGMWERTITIGSSGKSFGVTGWKLGWYIAADNLTQQMHAITDAVVFSSNKPMQEALAKAFERELKLINSPDSFFCDFLQRMESKRNRLAKILVKAGLTPFHTQGGFYLIADGSALKIPELQDLDSTESYDIRLVKWLITSKGVATIPVSPCYSKSHKDYGKNYIRFCFAKMDLSFEKLEMIFKNGL